MSGIVIDKNLCIHCETCVSSCPFSALEIVDGEIEVTAACRNCKVCVGVCPVEAISFETIEIRELDNSLFKGVMVYCEQEKGNIHPVTFELLGKGRELADKVHEKLYAVIIGDGITDKADLLKEYQVDEVLVYDHKALANYREDNYTNCFADAINVIKPSVVLVGSSIIGRSLAPSVATRFRTGLTADTTILDIRENGELVQIRPAFGGNIMAQIVTRNSRPQFATVRYKVMNPKERVADYSGEVVIRPVDASLIESRIEVLETMGVPAVNDISDADIIVAMGLGVSDEKGVELVNELAELLHATVGYSRPMVEKGIGTNHFQIGLSGRTVKPKLIITVGISGAIQFTSGMNASETIIAINNDPDAPIFKIANYAVVGDLYKILPELIRLIKEGGHNE